MLRSQGISAFKQLCTATPGGKGRLSASPFLQRRLLLDFPPGSRERRRICGARERGPGAMEQTPPRRSRSRARSAPKAKPAWRSRRRRSAASSESTGNELWLFPSSAGLCRTLSRRFRETRQICCTRERLAVLARSSPGVEVHLLPARGDSDSKPKYIKLERKMKIHSVDQGAEHMLILSSDGKLFEYGNSTQLAKLQCVLQEKLIIQIACGENHSLALSKGGELFAWGQNSYGQLGLGRTVGSTLAPQIVTRLTGIPLAQISAGEAHSLALSMSGNMYSWGKNDFGQLGLGHTNNKDSPSLVEEFNNHDVEFLTCGGSHTALLTKDGLLFTFGDGQYGQLGHNSTQKETRPRLVTELAGNKVTQVACGRYHTLAYVSDLGKIFSFGSGKEGQLGNGKTSDQLRPLPMKLSSKGDFKFESHTSEKELIVIAGGNQSILLWMEKENSYVNLRRKIPTLNEETTKRWIANAETKQWQSIKREIREIFSSPACLIGSFLKKSTATETMSIPLDLNKARDLFKQLSQKDCITNTITGCLRNSLLRNLPLHSPHQEALAIFLLLPECPVMQDSNNWQSLVVPFAEAVCEISNQDSEVLEKYWVSLEESAFSELIQMFKRAVVSQVNYWADSIEDRSCILALLRTLEKLHRVNQAKHQLPENTFIINELLERIDFYKMAYRRAFCKVAKVFSEDVDFSGVFSHLRFVFNSLSKIKLFYADSAVKMQMNSMDFRRFRPTPGLGEYETPLQPMIDLTVRRSHLIEDVFNQLSQFENEDLGKNLRVSFRGEINHHSGGVKSEFFHCIFEEMTQPEYGMFIYPEEASSMWFPVRPKFEEKRYFFFGVLCGLSLFNFNVANIPFPLALFKKLLDQIPSLEDLEELSPVLGKSLHILLDDEGDDFEEVFCVNFNAHWDKNDTELIPNGNYIMVNQTNKREYVSKYVDYIFNVSVKAVYEEFQRGFYSVCDKEMIEIFHPEELKTMIIGNADYDWEAFEKNACYGEGYSSSHPTIVMFWEALHKLTLEEKKKFLVFLTGTDRLQMKGIKDMQITFRCSESLNEKDPIRAQTCFSTLYLPKYSTVERMEEALHTAIDNSRGFG